MSEDNEDKKKETEEEEFIKQVRDDMSIDVYDLINESRDVPNILQKYADYLRSLKQKRSKVKIKLDEVYHQQLMYYMKDHEIRFNSTDARKMAECDPRMIKIRKIYDDLDIKVDYVNNIMWNLKEKTKSISNIIQVKKLELS